MAVNAPVSNGSPLAASWTKALPAFAAFAIPGVGLIGFALVRLLWLIHAINARAPLVTLQPLDVIGLTIGISSFGFAALTLSRAPAKELRRRRTTSPNVRSLDWTTVCLSIVVAGIALSAVAPWIASAMVEAMVAERGYAECTPPPDERRPPLRWVLPTPGYPDGRCPRTWREAHGDWIARRPRAE